MGSSDSDLPDDSDLPYLDLAAVIAASGTDHDVHESQERLAERYGALVGFVMTERGLGSLSAFIGDVLRNPEAVPAEGRSLWDFFVPAFVDPDGELSGPTPDDFGCPEGVGVEDWFVVRLEQLLSQVYRDNPGLLSMRGGAPDPR